MTALDVFADWLLETITVSSDSRYRHRALLEVSARRSETLPFLKAYIQQAHEDARRHLREVARWSLDPLQPADRRDPAEGYPELLHIQVQKGYFGEAFAGFVAENLAPHGINDWKVVAFLFRFHDVAFQHIGDILAGVSRPKILPGRLGDDCVAFQRDTEGRVIRVLLCEAKCTADHREDLIADAHEKISHPSSLTGSLHQTIEVLRDREDDPDAATWLESMQQMRMAGTTFERCDLVCYVCGRPPKQKDSWIPSDSPHKKYGAGRRLEAVEVYLNDVEGLVRLVYDKDCEGNGTS